MKKVLISIVLIFSLFMLSGFKVSADELNFDLIYEDEPSISCDNYYFSYNYLLDKFEEEIKHLYSLVIKNYNDNYLSDYKYYVISLFAEDSKNCNSSRQGVSKISMSLLAFNDEIPFFYFNFYGYNVSGLKPKDEFSNVGFTYTYNVTEKLYDVPSSSSYHSIPMMFYIYDEVKHYNPLYYFISNYNFVNSPVTYNFVDGSNSASYSYDVTGYGSDFTIGVGDTVYPMFSADNPFGDSNSLIEVNLNDYDSVILSLKDYSKEEEFITNVKVKGQYCLTPVYNYGMTERKDILSGSQVDRCSPYYDNFTPIRMYITENDLKNHAIYYLKSYDKTKENKVKIDTSVFDITYVTEENKDDPYVTINGKKYPVIPYDKLNDTSTKSEDEDYKSGASCAVGDFNCTNNILGNSFSFSDIFTSPLEFLKNVWESIVHIFTLITYFISILPVSLQYFLYISFTLAIVLGLIKILL